MSEQVVFTENTDFGFGFIDSDEYKYRNQVGGPDSQYRPLRPDEIYIMQLNGCTADSWENVIVKDGFDPLTVQRTSFFGKNRIGVLRRGNVQFHDYAVPCGIINSTIISCDIGDYSAIKRVSYLSHYIVGDRCILANINEMQTTNHSKFGNGIVTEGEDPSVRVDVAVMNENQGRMIAPFADLIVADAMLWADNPGDRELNKALWNLTDSSYDHHRGWYGEVGPMSVIKNCQVIKDVKFGSACYIKGCNKLKNLTVKSSLENPTQFGEGCELVNGIVGYGCKVFYGCKAVRFVMCENSNLKYGARLINSVLGDNSTVSCCEVISNLVFPFHEQHHNNSFLISSLIMGQSNMAAGANIGSNHNSRGADGELRAGRGFWPALSSTIKFDSRFASFVLISKGNYNYELNIKTPFALLSDNVSDNMRELMPGYWWMYNMYALERNSAKFHARDKRKYALQHIETDYLAPDTVWEILDGMRLLCKWTAGSLGYDSSECNIIEEGKRILETDYSELSGHEVFAMRQEHSATRVRILKPRQGYNAYRDMLLYYGIKESLKYCAENSISFSELDARADAGTFDWVNLGGQLIPAEKLEILKQCIKNGDFKHWNEVHEVYDRWWSEYPEDKALNAVATLHRVLGVNRISEELFETLVQRLRDTREYIDRQVYLTREKDYRNSFRMINYRNTDERDAVIGKLEDNSFVRQTRKITETWLSYIPKVVFEN